MWHWHGDCYRCCPYQSTIQETFMTLQRLFTQFCTILAVSASLAAPALAADRGPSTPEEHARVVQIAAASDKDPIATMTSADGRWMEKWVDEVPDYMFGPDKGAFWFMTTAAKGDLKRVMRFHHTVSIAAFQVQNKMFDPDRKPDHLEAKTLAGVEGLLRAYEALLPKRPENRSDALDLAIAARNKGTLAEFVRALPPMPPR
jgi:hypothetical protein